MSHSSTLALTSSLVVGGGLLVLAPGILAVALGRQRAALAVQRLGVNGGSEEIRD